MIDDPWSEEGQEEFDRSMHQHFEMLYARSTSVNISRWPQFDIMDLRGFPDPSLCMFVTRYLSQYILKLGESRHVRLELCLTTHLDKHEQFCRRVLFELGSKCLSQHQAIQAGEILHDYDLPLHLLQAKTQIHRLWTRLGMWLDEGEYEIDGQIPAYFVELVPLTKEEADRFEHDSDAFYEACQRGGADFLELAR